MGVPRNKIDCVVTEYGWRSLRYASIGERARAMIELADSRFQEELLREARQMGLVGSGYTIPAAFRDNTYDALVARYGDMARRERLPLGPGFDLAGYTTEEERSLLSARDACVA